MAMPQPRQPVKLICGLMWAESIESSLIEERLEKEFGPIESRSPILSFDHTDYYESEFGPGLKKLYLSFESLVSLESIPSCKHWTNHLAISIRTANIRRDHHRIKLIHPQLISTSKCGLELPFWSTMDRNNNWVRSFGFGFIYKSRYLSLVERFIAN